MNEKVKIISIARHEPLPVHLQYKNPEQLNKVAPMEFAWLKADRWLGFWKYDFHVQSMQEIKKICNDFSFECWRPYGPTIDQMHSKEVDGIIHKIFPSNSIYIPFWGTIIKSKQMQVELLREIKANKVLIYFNDGHSRMVSWLILSVRDLHVPIVYHHRSSAFGIFRYKYLPWYKKYNLSSILNYFLFEKKALHRIDYYLSNSKVEIEFIKNILSDKKTALLKDGINFEFFHPDSKNRSIIRSKYGLDQNDIVILYVGRFYKVKDLDILIRVYLQIKEKDKRIKLMLVGGYKTDELYQIGKNSGAILIERVPEEELRLYYQSSDIYVMPVKNKTVKYFGGFGSAPIQALACGLPVISDNIMHFPGTAEEKAQIGMEMRDEKELNENLLRIISNRKQFANCREIAQKYFDIRNTTTKKLHIFNELVQKYFE